MKDAAYLGTLQTYWKWKRHQTFPPMAKLCEVSGLSSTSSVFALIGGGSPKLATSSATRAASFRRGRSLLARCWAQSEQACPATQEEPELITLDDYLIDNPSRTSVHKVRGDSMKDVGIFEGELVVVEHNSLTSAGDIVVAIVDGEFTVKTLRRPPKAATTLSHPTQCSSPSTRPARWSFSGLSSASCDAFGGDALNSSTH